MEGMIFKFNYSKLIDPSIFSSKFNNDSKNRSTQECILYCLLRWFVSLRGECSEMINNNKILEKLIFLYIIIN